MMSKSLCLIILTGLIALALAGWSGCGKDDKPTNPPDTLNHAPIIESLDAEPDTFVMGGSCVVTVTAGDPDSDALSYDWEKRGELEIISTEANTARVINCCPIFEITRGVVLSTVRDGRGGEALDSISVWILPPLK